MNQDGQKVFPSTVKIHNRRALGFNPDLWSAAATEKPDRTRAEVTSTVIKVYNGNTVKLANVMEVRYLGLDTPETHHPENPVEYFSVKVSKFNNQLVNGKKVILETTSKRKTSACDFRTTP